MKGKNKNIDEILERYLPRASDEEVRSARDRFLVFLHADQLLAEPDQHQWPDHGSTPA